MTPLSPLPTPILSCRSPRPSRLRFHTSFTDSLTLHPTAIYDAMDIHERGGMNLDEFNAGLKMFSFGRPVVLSVEDFDAVTKNGEFLDENGDLVRGRGRERGSESDRV